MAEWSIALAWKVSDGVNSVVQGFESLSFLQSINRINAVLVLVVARDLAKVEGRVRISYTAPNFITCRIVVGSSLVSQTTHRIHYRNEPVIK